MHFRSSSSLPTNTNDALYELNTTNKSLLIDGYCTSHNLEPIPTDICNLISIFNKSIIWTISTSTFQQLSPIHISANSIELNRLSSPIFTTETTETKFQLRMERTSGNNIQIQLYLISDLEFHHIKRISMSISFICNELLTETRQCCLMDTDYNYIDVVTALPFNKILNYKQLTISCNIEILSIEYNDFINRNPFIKPIQLNNNNEEIQFEWDITVQILKQFTKTVTETETFWPKNNFGIDNNFCVYCVPNLNGFCVLFLQLLKLQYPKNGIYIKYKMEIMSNNTIIKQYESLNPQWLSCQSTLCWNDKPIQFKQLLKLNKIKFITTITILKHNDNV